MLTLIGTIGRKSEIYQILQRWMIGLRSLHGAHVPRRRVRRVLQPQHGGLHSDQVSVTNTQRYNIHLSTFCHFSKNLIKLCTCIFDILRICCFGFVVFFDEGADHGGAVAPGHGERNYGDGFDSLRSRCFRFSNLKSFGQRQDSQNDHHSCVPHGQVLSLSPPWFPIIVSIKLHPKIRVQELINLQTLN